MVARKLELTKAEKHVHNFMMDTQLTARVSCHPSISKGRVMFFLLCFKSFYIDVVDLWHANIVSGI